MKCCNPYLPGLDSPGPCENARCAACRFFSPKTVTCDYYLRCFERRGCPVESCTRFAPLTENAAEGGEHSMEQLPDSPLISRMNSSGEAPSCTAFCCRCGEELSGRGYELSSLLFCEDCFIEAFREECEQHPERIADALDIPILLV